MDRSLRSFTPRGLWLGRALLLGLSGLALSAAATPGFATAWRSIGPGGGAVGAPLVAPSNHRVAFATSGDPTGIFRTGDGGRTWQHLDIRSAPRASSVVAIDPKNPKLLLGLGIVANAERLLASRDGGTHWRLASEGLPLDGNGHVDLQAGVVFDPARAGHLLAGTRESGLFESRDAGAHWIPAGFADGVVIALGAAAPNGLWLALASGTDEAPAFQILRSRDGGARWTSTALPAEEGLTSSVFRFDERSPERPFLLDSGRLFRRGVSGWNRLATSERIFDLAVLADGTLVAATDRGPRRSHDGGTTWTGTGGPAITRVAAIGPREVLATDSSLMWRSVDGGKRFRNSSRGLDAQVLYTLGAAADGTLWAGLQGPGLMRSRDHGETWTRQPRGLGIDPQAYPPLPLAFAISPTTPEAIYAVLFVESGAKLARSRDGGDAWSYATVPPSSGRFSNVLLGVDGRDPDRLVWAATSSESTLVSFLWTSADGGASWSEPFRFRERQFLLDLAIDPVDPDTVLALSTDGLWRSHDGGRSFALTGSGLTLGLATGFTLAIDPENHRNVYVAAANGLYRSRDGGATFRQLGPSLGRAGQRGIALAAGGRILVSSREEGVLVWRPATRRFESVGAGLPSNAFNARILVDPTDRSTIYAATFGRSVWRLDLDE